MPSALAEIAFVTNREESRLLKTESFSAEDRRVAPGGYPQVSAVAEEGPDRCTSVVEERSPLPFPSPVQSSYAVARHTDHGEGHRGKRISGLGNVMLQAVGLTVQLRVADVVRPRAGGGIIVTASCTRASIRRGRANAAARPDSWSREVRRSDAAPHSEVKANSHQSSQTNACWSLWHERLVPSATPCRQHPVNPRKSPVNSRRNSAAVMAPPSGACVQHVGDLASELILYSSNNGNGQHRSPALSATVRTCSTKAAGCRKGRS